MATRQSARWKTVCGMFAFKVWREGSSIGVKFETRSRTLQNVLRKVAFVFPVACGLLIVRAAEIPEGCIILEASDSGIYYSLTTDCANNNWSDHTPIHEGNYYIPAGLLAVAENKTQTVVPTIFCAGSVQPLGGGSAPATFNDLRLLDGGELRHKQICTKCGTIKILSDNTAQPACFSFDRTDRWTQTFRLGATIIGSKDSQLLYRMSSSGLALLELRSGSDWSGFEGTLHIANGVGIQNYPNVPVTMPGAVRFGTGGILDMMKNNAAYSFGDLSFVKDVAITNTGSGATLTVSGTFDTGTNCFWHIGNSGTFGHLVMGNGLYIHNEQITPTAVLNVTNRLEIGENVTIHYSNMSMTQDLTPKKVLFMRIAPDAVAAGVPDLSPIRVSFAARQVQLTMEEDPEVNGGRLVYATLAPIVDDPVVYYNGPDEWLNADKQGEWLDPNTSTAFWEDGLYPNGDKAYCVTQNVFFATGRITTFPGKTLVCDNSILYVTASSSCVTNLLLLNSAILYGRIDKLHFGGNLTPVGTQTVRELSARSFYLDSTVHGNGSLVFNSYYPDPNDGGATFYLTADNSDWTGKWTTSWTEQNSGSCPADEDKHVRIVVGSFASLGGNPATFVHDAQKLSNFAELHFTNTTVQTASNRGLFVENGIVRVDQGATADMIAPVTLKGTFRKVGAGTLGLAGGIRWAQNDDLADMTQPAEGANMVLIQEGAIKGGALSGANVTFAAETAIVADAVSGALDLSDATVVASGNVYLTADANTLPAPTQNVTYPIVKVSSAAATALGASFQLMKSPWRGWQATLVSEPDGLGAVLYSLKYAKRGFALLVR